MFEHEREIVNILLNENNDFQRIFNKYDELKEQVNNIHAGSQSTDDLELERLKKQKLYFKDQMATMIANYRHGRM